MFRTWAKVLTRPSEQVFVVERDRVSATLLKGLAWIVLANAVAWLVGLGADWATSILVIPREQFNPSEAPPRYFNVMFTSLGAIRIWLLAQNIDLSNLFANLWSIQHPVVETLGYHYYYLVLSAMLLESWLLNAKDIILKPLYFLTGMIVYHSLAKLLGGRGQFGRYVFLFALFGVPIVVVSSLFDLIPLIGPLVAGGKSSVGGQFFYIVFNQTVPFTLSWLLSFYGVALAYMATRVEHGLSWWRVVIVVAIGYVASYVIRNSLWFAYFGFLQSI